MSAECILDEMAAFVARLVLPDGAGTMADAAGVVARRLHHSTCHRAGILHTSGQPAGGGAPGCQLHCPVITSAALPRHHEGEGTTDYVNNGMDSGGLATP